MNRKLAKLHTLNAAQEMTNEILDSLGATITEDSSDEEFVTYGRYQMNALNLEVKIRNLRHELKLPQTRFKILK